MPFWPDYELPYDDQPSHINLNVRFTKGAKILTGVGFGLLILALLVWCFCKFIFIYQV